MSFSGSLTDRLNVREFYGHFSYASSLALTDEWLSCWSDQCQWRTTFFSLEGKQQLQEQWHALWQNFDKVALLCEIGSIRIENDRAYVTSIAREVIRLKTGEVQKLAGSYSDTLERHGDSWRFLQRDYELLISEPDTQ